MTWTFRNWELEWDTLQLSQQMVTSTCSDLAIGECLVRETRMTLDSRNQQSFPNFKSLDSKLLMLLLENITPWHLQMMEAFGPGDMLVKRVYSIGCTLKKSELLDTVTKNYNLYLKRWSLVKRTSKLKLFQPVFTIAMPWLNQETYTLGAEDSTVCLETDPINTLLSQNWTMFC